MGGERKRRRQERGGRKREGGKGMGNGRECGGEGKGNECGRERNGRDEIEGKGREPQGLVYTPMFEILKNTLLRRYGNTGEQQLQNNIEIGLMEQTIV